MEKRCMATMVFGDYYEAISETTLPHMKAYSQKHGIPLHIINERKISSLDTWGGICWEKYQVADLLAEYDAVLFVDIDCVIKPNCGNLFDVYRGGFVASIWDDNPFEHIKRFAESLGFKRHSLLDMNSGVWLIRKSHRMLLELPETIPDTSIHPVGEQCWFSIRLMETGMKWEWLHSRYNCMDLAGDWEIFHAVMYKNSSKLHSLRRASNLFLPIKIL